MRVKHGARDWLVGEQVEIRWVKYDNVLGTAIPVEMDGAGTAAHLLHRPTLAMIAGARHIYPNALAVLYVFHFHDVLRILLRVRKQYDCRAEQTALAGLRSIALRAILLLAKPGLAGNHHCAEEIPQVHP